MEPQTDSAVAELGRNRRAHNVLKALRKKDMCADKNLVSGFTSIALAHDLSARKWNAAEWGERG